MHHTLRLIHTSALTRGAAALAVILVHGIASAQPSTVVESSSGALGAYAGIVRGGLDAAFNITRAGVVHDGECGRYEHGAMSGFVAGIMGELPVASSIGLTASTEFAHRDAELSYPCIDPAGTRMPDGTVADATTEFRAVTSYDVIAIAAGATIRPFALPFVVGLTPTLSVCSGARYDARETIVTPTSASFVEGGQSRHVGTGHFETGDVSFAFKAALWYEARIARRWFIVPRVAGFVGLSDELAAGALRSSGLDFTLGIVYHFTPGTNPSTPIEPGTPPPVALPR